MALKVAILASGQRQRVIARRARIENTRFSRIVNGVYPPTDRERQRIAQVLNRTEIELFAATAVTV